MEALNETAVIDRELQRAREDLRETLEQVNHKVEEVEARLSPRAIVRRNPYTLVFLAGAIGFIAGSDRQQRPLRWLAIAGLLGIASTASHRSVYNGSNAATQ